MGSMGRTTLVLLAAGALALAWPNSALAQRKGKPAAAQAEKPAKGQKGQKGEKGQKAERGQKGEKGQKADAPAQSDKEPEARIERTERGGKVIKLSPIVVEGKVQKPLALVIARQQVQYDWEKLKQDFTPKIVEAVSKSPF
jgi:hypothetical protein